MLKAGRRTKEWDRIRADLKPLFEAVGITWCEFRYTGCWRDNGLSFAHTDKRRFLKGDQLYVVALACANCHPMLEILKREEMKERVLEVITRRACQPHPLCYPNTE